MPGDHYFTATPASADERRTMTVPLAGRDVRVHTAPGIFSPGRLDLGTQVLLRTVPDPPAVGNLLDLGCGWGPLALTMALRSPAAVVWAVDVNERALDLLRATARDLGLAGIRAVVPDDVPADLAFDAIWSNPPIRVGKETLHGLLRSWLPRLGAGAAAHLVVQRNLGADSLQRWIELELGAGPGGGAAGLPGGGAAGPGGGAAGLPGGAAVPPGAGLRAERVASAKGFRVLRVSRAADDVAAAGPAD